MIISLIAYYFPFLLLFYCGLYWPLALQQPGQLPLSTCKELAVVFPSTLLKKHYPNYWKQKPERTRFLGWKRKLATWHSQTPAFVVGHLNLGRYSSSVCAELLQRQHVQKYRKTTLLVVSYINSMRLIHCILQQKIGNLAWEYFSCCSGSQGDVQVVFHSRASISCQEAKAKLKFIPKCNCNLFYIMVLETSLRTVPQTVWTFGKVKPQNYSRILAYHS